jgi:hypothetical protein
MVMMLGPGNMAIWQLIPTTQASKRLPNIAASYKFQEHTWLNELILSIIFPQV